jgi:ATP-dependent Lhr-like helicase
MGKDAFDLLHPAVQRQLWDMKWTHLRPLQVQAIRAILADNDHLILSAATAAGKTEAAFLPIISKIADESKGCVQALYVGPLKALINDQFERIRDLCGHIDVPVYHWHGDVSAADKKRLIERPGGVLLITPESLESLFVNRSAYLQKLFGRLKFAVIDELHSFLGNERGLHLRSLLCRLRLVQQPGEDFRLVGLSATIGDMSVAQRYIELDASYTSAVIVDDTFSSDVKLRLYGYREVPPPKDEITTEAFRVMTMDLVKHCQGASNLVFANAKVEVEELADLASRIGAEQHLRDRFLVHHGSLSAELREEAETVMKSGVPATAFCSSTLEMGIDIGSVKMVGQVGAPWSVASLRQRLGRSGRREGEARILRMYVRCEEADAKSSIFDRLHLELIQAIAVVELMLKNWLEPSELPRCDLSTLTQQIMSVIAQTGGIRADQLFDRLCGRGTFRDVEKSLFAMLLRQLANRDVIEQMPEGDLIMGLKGEQLRKDKGFYAVFATPEEFAVLWNGRRLGTVSLAPQVNDHLLLAGQRWQVSHVDYERLEISVRPARGWRPPNFSGGRGEIRPEIRQEMRRVLSGAGSYSYLNVEAGELLAEARNAAKSADLAERALVPLGTLRCALMTWTGTTIQATLQAMLTEDETPPKDEGIALVFAVGIDKVRDVIRRVTLREHKPSDVAENMPGFQRRKYDWLLSDQLKLEVASRAWVDVPGAMSVLNRLHSEIST